MRTGIMGLVRLPTMLAATGWILLLLSAQGLLLPELCSAAAIPISLVTSPIPLELFLSLNPASDVLGSWSVMLGAMMIPLVSQQLAHIEDRAAGGGHLAQLVFLSSYGVAWLGGLTILAGMTLALHQVAPNSAFVVVTILAGLWQETATKAKALRRCHQRPALRWRGVRLISDVARYGFRTGGWCMMSCGPLMLICVVSNNGFWSMALVASFLWYERPAAAPLTVSTMLARLHSWLKNFFIEAARTNREL